MDEPLDTTPIYHFNRAHLMMGGEREVVMVAILFAMILFVLQSLYAAIFAVIWLFVAFAAAKSMAKSDPALTKVYRRYSAYQRFYPAHSVKYLHNPRAR